MIRRRFLALLPLAGAGGLSTIKGLNRAEKNTVKYKVSGFTCITCAVGLETLMNREDGVIAAKATYPEAIATIIFDAKAITQARIVQAIEEMGFKAELLQS